MSTTTDLMGLGMAPALAALVATNSVMTNNTALQGTTTGAVAQNLIKIDGSDNTIVDSASGKKISLDVNATEVMSVAGSLITAKQDLTYSGSGIGPLFQVATVAAAGTTQADGGALTTTITYVTGANGTTGVVLPAASAAKIGRMMVVVNTDVTNALKVYAAGSDTITAQAGSTAISVAAKVSCIFFQTTATAWQGIKCSAIY